jgi:hypothetical protein
LGVHGGQRVGVDDQFGAKDDSAEQPEVNIAGLKTAAT